MRALALMGALVGILAFGVPNAFATFHGVAQAKTCVSPTSIGNPYTCQGSILNTVDQGGDTIEVTGMNDTVNASGGSVATGNILPTTGLFFGGTGTVTCFGHVSGDGIATPWLGATDCFLTFGATITTAQFSHYTVQPGDFNIPSVTTLKSAASAGDTTIALQQAATAVPGNTIVIDPTGANPETRVVTSVFNSAPGVLPVVHTITFATPLGFAHLAGVNVNQFAHRLTDSLNWNWNNTCTFDPTGDCTTNPQVATAGASTLVQKLNSSTSTTIHNAAHGPVTVVEAGSVVHDSGTVSGQPGLPNPSGNVNIDFFSGGTAGNECSGTPVNSGPVPLDPSGNFDATGFAQGPLSAGFYGFIAHYTGDGTYNGSDGVCEPLRVVDANIQLTPPTATNHVGSPHVLTCHINVNDGSGQVNAPDGTSCAVSIVSGPGSPVSQSCTTTGGSCQVTISSSTTGMSTIQASTSVAVAGLVLNRATGDLHPGDSPNAQKLWVNAAITIAPNATNEVNHSHTFTATLLFDTGSGLVPAGAGQNVTVTLTNGGGAVANPAGPFSLVTNAAGQVQVTFTSATPGTVTGNASWTGSILGSAPFTVQTDGTGSNSGPAVKTFVDANIQITPATAANPVGTNHVLTITVNAIGGTIDPGPHTATATIQSGPGSFVGGNTCTYTGGGASASCTVTITSSTTGTTVVSAASSIPVNGVSISRDTNGNAGPGGSGNASKQWVKAKITIAPNATNEIGQPHTFTATVFTDNGSGYQPVGAGVDCEITLTGSNGAVPNPAAPLTTTTNAAGQCSYTFTSATAGKVTGHAKSVLQLAGQTVTVETDGLGDNSGNAVKTFVDARISITPATANNPVGANHVLTATVTVNDGSGAGFVPAADGTSISFTIDSGPGAFTTANPCTTAGGTGSCTITLVSSTPGTTVVSAHVTLSVGGVSLTRSTNGSAGNSGPASKNWADDTIVTHVLDASNNDITGTTVNAGTVVHDTASVAKAAGTPASVPAPTGTVTFTLYDNGTCNGNVLATDPNKPLSGGTATSVTFTTPATAGSFSYLAHYNGDANYPGHDAGCEPFNTKSTPTGLIAPTQTTCNDVLNGTAAVLGQVNYSLSGGVIGQSINPGVFFFYSKITTTTPNQVVTVTQSNTSTNNSALFGVQQGQAWLWSGDCSSKIVGTTFGSNGSQARFTVPTPGNYIIGIKYSTKSIAGTVAPVPANITFNFATSLGGTTGASVDLVKQ